MLEAFQPQGNTLLILATTTANTAVQASTLSVIGYKVLVTGASPVFLADGSASATLATLPTTAVPAVGTGMPLLPGTDQTFNFAPNAYFSVITAAGTASVYITPGFGV